MTDESRASLTHALDGLRRDARHHVRDQVHYLCRLAACDLLDGHLDGACATAGEAAELGRRLASARVGERLLEFNDTLEPFAASSAVRGFREKLSATSA
jgi:hypothetical protein